MFDIYLDLFRKPIIIKTITFFLTLLICGLHARGQYTDTAIILIGRGQSNMSGNELGQRLSNPYFNYFGISAGYPAARTTQPTYDSVPAGVRTWIQPVPSHDIAKIKQMGQWQQYHGGYLNNTSVDEKRYSFNVMLSLAQRLFNKTQDSVFVIPIGYGGTGQVPGYASATPGSWYSVLDTLTTLWRVFPAMDTVVSQHPNTYFQIVVLNYQGEQDAQNGALCYSQHSFWFNLSRNRLDSMLQVRYPTLPVPYWVIMGLNHEQTLGELSINIQQAVYAATRPRTYFIPNNFKRRMELDSLELIPMKKDTLANFPAAGGGDSGNKHLSYIGLLSLGEKAFDWLYPRLYPMSPVNLCAVTPDNVTGKNLLVWNKLPSASTDSFVLYRGTSNLGVYQRIGAQAFAAFSTFQDSGVNNSRQAYRYYIAAKNGYYETPLFQPHRTMHLSISQGLEKNSWNLIWNGYEGFNHNVYTIWRGTSQTNMTVLASVEANDYNSYTDRTNTSKKFYYRVSVANAPVCTPAARTTGDYAISSNIVLAVPAEMSLDIYPNPASAAAKLSVSGPGETFTVRVIDITGVVRQEFVMKYDDEAELSSSFPPGIYLVEASNGQLRTTMRWVKL